MRPRLLIFASGTKESGGSGFENLVHASKDGRLAADIVGVVSNHERGGVAERAKRLGVPFTHFLGPYEASDYESIVSQTTPDFIALSGWLKLVKGLDPKTTFNIHPGPVPEFGGPGLYGDKVHEAVLEAYRQGRLTHSAVCMHFVTPEYDRGPLFFRHEVPIDPSDTPETLKKRIQEAEYRYQPEITDKVVRGEISWDGKDPTTLSGGLFD